MPRLTVVSPEAFTPAPLASAVPRFDMRKLAALSFACCSVSRCAKAEDIISNADRSKTILFIIIVFSFVFSQLVFIKFIDLGAKIQRVMGTGIL